MWLVDRFVIVVARRGRCASCRPRHAARIRTSLLTIVIMFSMGRNRNSFVRNIGVYGRLNSVTSIGELSNRCIVLRLCSLFRVVVRRLASVLLRRVVRNMCDLSWLRKCTVMCDTIWSCVRLTMFTTVNRNVISLNSVVSAGIELSFKMWLQIRTTNSGLARPSRPMVMENIVIVVTRLVPLFCVVCSLVNLLRCFGTVITAFATLSRVVVVVCAASFVGRLVVLLCDLCGCRFVSVLGLRCSGRCVLTFRSLYW